MKSINHIAVDARCLLIAGHVNRGIGRYIINFLNTLAKVFPKLKISLYFEENSDIEELKNIFLGDNFNFCFYDLKKNIDADIFLICDPMTVFIGYDSPFRFATNIPSCLIFYDLIPILCPNVFKNWFWDEQNAYKIRVIELLNSNSLILSISENTKKDIIKYLEYPPELIIPIMAGLNEKNKLQNHSQEEINNTLAKFNISTPFFMTVGGCDPHKNFRFSLFSFLRLLRKFKEKNLNINPKLVVIGDLQDPYKVKFKQFLDKKNIKDVIFTDYVSQEELGCLYSSSTALLFPSQIEGFGFPVLEAISNKCPVITTCNASIPEIMGENGLYVNTKDKTSMINIMEKLLCDKNFYNLAIINGLERAKLFSWEATVKKAMQAMEKFINDNHPKLNNNKSEKDCIISFNNEIKKIDVDARALAFASSSRDENYNYNVNLLKAIAQNFPQICLNLKVNQEEDILILKNIFNDVSLQYEIYNSNQYSDANIYFISSPLSIRADFDNPYRYCINLPVSTFIYDFKPLNNKEIIFESWQETTKNTFSLRLKNISKYSNQILTPSDFAKQNAIKYLNFPNDKIFNISTGYNKNNNINSINPNDLFNKLNISRSFFLVTKSNDETSNFKFLLTSFLKAVYICCTNRVNPPLLVVIGDTNIIYKQELIRFIQSNQLTDFVLFIDYLNQDELFILYKNALALLYADNTTECCENILDAMSLGCPLITTNEGALKELNSNCRLNIDLSNARECSNLLITLLQDSDLQNKLKTNSIAQSQLFSWDNVAKKVVEAWKRI